MEDAVHVLSASDNFGMTVDPSTALSVFKDMCAHGFITRRGTDCRLSLPSLASRLAEMRQDEDSHSKAVQAIRDAASAYVERKR